MSSIMDGWMGGSMLFSGLYEWIVVELESSFYILVVGNKIEFGKILEVGSEIGICEIG